MYAYHYHSYAHLALGIICKRAQAFCMGIYFLSDLVQPDHACDVGAGAESAWVDTWHVWEPVLSG